MEYPKAPRILGVTGYKRAGKDSVCQALRGFGYKPIAFAAPMKEMIVHLLRYQGCSEDIIARMLDGDLKEAPSDFLGGRSMRYALQTIGTEWGRDLMGEGFWRDIAFTLIRMQPERRFIISDVRFVNEANLIHGLGGKIIRVTRPGTGAGDLHQSEVEIADVPEDFTIANNGTREELPRRVVDLYNTVISKL